MKRNNLHRKRLFDWWLSSGGDTPAFSSFAQSFKERVEADSGTFEAQDCLVTELTALGEDFLNASSFILTPNGYKVGKIYSAKPIDGSGDLTFTRSTVGYRKSSTLYKSEAIDTPRLGYLKDTCPSLLIEPAKTNLLLRSRELENASWTKTNVTISQDAIVGPDGVTTVDKIVETAAASTTHLIRQNLTKAASSIGYTVYCIVKKGERNWIRLMGWDFATRGIHAWFNLDTGTKHMFEAFGASGFTETEYDIIDLNNGWYFCYIKFFSNAATTLAMNVAMTTGDQITTYSGDGTSGLYYAGGGIVADASARVDSLIDTVTTSVARGVDTIAALTSFSANIGQTEGTIFIHLRNWVDDNVVKVFSLSDGTTDNIIEIRLDDKVYANITAATVAQAALSSSVFLPNTEIKIAITYQANKAALFVNGQKIGEDLTVTVPACDEIHFSDGAGSNPLYANIELISVSPTAITDAEAQTLTTVDDFADFLLRLPPTRHGATAILANDGTYINTCPGGIIIDPLDSSKFLFYLGEFLGPTTVGGRVSLHVGDIADPYDLSTDLGPVLVATASSPDENGCRYGCVLNVGGTVYYYYVGVDASYDWRIMLATSVDGGRTFTKQGVVLDFNSVDEFSLSGPMIIIEDGVWYMVYTVWDGVATPPNNNPGDSNLGMKLATSVDGITWVKTDTYLLRCGSPATTDTNALEDGQLLKYGDKYIILYNGENGAGQWKIYMAYSDDITKPFTKISTVFFDIAGSGWDDSLVACPYVHEFPSGKVFYYQGAGATGSPDPIDVGAADLTVRT